MTSELAEKIGHVPEAYDTADRSIACLLQDAGFPELRGAVTVAEIECVLRQDPDLVELWFERGGDQRLAGGWGTEQEAGEYRVQSFCDGEHLLIRDHVRACAEFVVRYVRFIGDVQARTR